MSLCGSRTRTLLFLNEQTLNFHIQPRDYEVCVGRRLHNALAQLVRLAERMRNVRVELRNGHTAAAAAAAAAVACSVLI